ncbi:MAG: protein TolB [Paracoccaceae bacterium]|nr:MAG: protein TolB [Paracoccaceae bacterium]
MVRTLMVCLLALIATTSGAQEPGPLRLTISDPNVEPMPIAVPVFIAETPDAAALAAQITDVATNDLTGTALFRLIPREAYLARPASVDAAPDLAAWRAINADKLIVGAVATLPDGRLAVKFRLWDVATGQEDGAGLQFAGSAAEWRRLGHKLADEVYTRITGEGPYFDSRIVFVAESGPRGARVKRLAIMDQDGANLRFLTDGRDLVLTPRFDPTSQRIVFLSYASGQPRVHLMDLATGTRTELEALPGMTFAPRFSPDGSRVVMSLTQGGNTDIYVVPLGSRQRIRLTDSPAIDTAPSFSPDGSRIVFESDRGGSQQLYVMPANGGEAQRISFGPGRYAGPVWSPRGDWIAFTKLLGGRFYIGVMRPDGSDERLLTASYIDEGPTWAPNGRVLMFFRDLGGPNAVPVLMSVDLTGRNLRRVPTDQPGSDPAWSPLLD